MCAAKFAVVEASGEVLFAHDDPCECLRVSRKHRRVRVYRCVDGVLLAFQTGVAPPKEVKEEQGEKAAPELQEIVEEADDD